MTDQKLIHEERVTFSTAYGTLHGVIHHPDSSPRGCIITCHGLLSTKDSDKYISLGEHFSRKRFALLRFDFRGCGESDGALKDSTVTARQEDLRAAVAYIERRLPSCARRLGFLGSSMGGFIALLVAPCHAAVKAVVTWAAPFSFEAVGKTVSRSTSPEIGLDFFTDAGRYRPQQFVPRVNNLLIIHGDRDTTVPVDHAHHLYRTASEPRGLKIIGGADHVFSNHRHRTRAISASLRWFQHYL